MIPDWLVWVRELQAIAQNGLTYTPDPYDRERYEQLQRVAAEIAAAATSATFTPIHHLFPPLTDSTLLDPYRHSHFAKDIGIKVANLILR